MADYWTFYRNNEFKDIVKSKIQAAAIAIMNEAAITANHAERVAYAIKILDGTASEKEFCIGVLTNTTLQGKITSGADYVEDLDFIVSSLFNAFAGIALTE